VQQAAIAGWRVAFRKRNSIPPIRHWKIDPFGKRRLNRLERHGDEWVRSDKEPGTSWWLRAAVSLLSLLPIDWLL
jgi:putative cardiolipin synthase